MSKNYLPILFTVMTFSLFFSIKYFFEKEMYYLFMSFITMFIFSLLWGSLIITEFFFMGDSNHMKKSAYSLGMGFFIFSEVMFFFSFFWNFFESSLSPNQEIGLLWPTFKIAFLNPFLFPFLNTLILLSSGFFVTLSHYYIYKNKKLSLVYLLFTIVLGLYFSSIQLFEYKNMLFSMMDSIFGSTFFILTGFHGIHVIVGSILLLCCLIRMYDYQMNSVSNLNFEMSIWYWHFVDVVWLFLFLFIYWWGSI